MGHCAAPKSAPCNRSFSSGQKFVAELQTGSELSQVLLVSSAAIHDGPRLFCALMYERQMGYL